MSAFLSVENVTRRFGGLVALDQVSLNVEQGRIHGIIGPNGAGKTTLFNIIAGAFPPSEGRLTLGGDNINRLSPEQRCARGIARTFQVPRPFNGLTVLDNVAVGALGGSSNVAEARTRASATIDLLEMGEHTGNLASTLTIGLRKRLEVARALATRPRLLLLDEVMGGLHGDEVDRMIATIRRIAETGVTVVLIEHVMPAIMSLAEIVTVLDQGRVLATGPPEEITRNPAVIAAYLGDEVTG
jgi:branched-chain amino acid transport system ATP-binding protein